MNRVLIAAGDPGTSQGIQSALSSAGFQTAVVTDCQQLVAFCHQHVPDLTVVDLDLPGGSIWTAVQAFRSDARLSKMPLIGLGGQLSDAEQEHASALGFSAVETKPVSMPGLIESIRRGLGAPATPPNVTPMPVPQPAAVPADSPEVHNPVGTLLKQIKEIRELTADLKPGVPTYGEEAPELFGYIENSGNQIAEELGKLSAQGIERSAIALLDKELRHDFRNMIGSVTGFSELLLMEPTVEGDARMKFTRIREICRDFCNILDEQKAAAA